MIVGSQRFPETAAGYHYAARHVFKLGPAFHDDARGLRDEAFRLEREAVFKRASAIFMFGLLALLLALTIGKYWQ